MLLVSVDVRVVDECEQEGKEVLVLLLGELCGSWKTSIDFYFTADLTARTQPILVHYGLGTLGEYGFIPHSLTA